VLSSARYDHAMPLQAFDANSFGVKKKVFDVKSLPPVQWGGQKFIVKLVTLLEEQNL